MRELADSQPCYATSDKKEKEENHHIMKLEELFSSVLALPMEHISDETSPSTVKSWDSMRHIQLVVSIEEVYQVSLTASEIRSLKSLGNARVLLQQKGVLL